MKVILTSLLYLTQHFSFAASLVNEKSDIKVYSEDNLIYLSALSCEDIENEVKIITSWNKQKLQEENTQNCECKNGNCILNITQRLPEVVKLYEGKRPDVNGPNCWNSTLVTAGILPHIRYSTPEEMEFWMKSPLCTEKKMSEEMEPGDVVAIRGEDSSEYHGFIYISDKISWSKNGFNRVKKYDLQDPLDVFETYGVEKECQRSIGNNKKCDKYANIYKCQPWDEYWEKVDEGIKSRVDESVELSLNHIECSLSESLFQKALIDQSSMDLMFNSLAIVEMLVLDLKEDLKEDASEEEKLYIDRSLHRILSIKDQYYFMEKLF